MTEDQITGPVARDMRLKLGMTQKDFWAPVGVTQSVACRYETSDVAVPRPVRILLVAHYISGVKIDVSTKESVADLARLGEIQSKAIHVKTITKAASADISKAVKSLTDAQQALSNV